MSEKGTERVCDLCDLVEVLERIEGCLRREAPDEKDGDIIRVVGDFMPLSDLKPGKVFVTEDGWIAFKTNTVLFPGSDQHKCFLLKNGKELFFANPLELVREVWLPFEVG